MLGSSFENKSKNIEIVRRTQLSRGYDRAKINLVYLANTKNRDVIESKILFRSSF